MRRALPVLVFVVALALAGMAWLAGFATGVVVNPPLAIAPAQVSPPANFGLFDEAWGVVNREFYGKRPAPADIANGAVAGLVGALDDPYAAFVRAQDRQPGVDPFHPALIDGLGAWVEPVADGVVVVALAPDSPAAKAKLLPGDLVLAGGDKPLAGMSYSDALKALAGNVDSKVTLVLQRQGGAPQSVEVTRAKVEVPDVVVSRPRPGVLMLRPSHFDANVVAGLDEALAGLKGEPADALVLDLRDNPGGSLDSVRAVAGRFFAGDVWTEVTKSGQATPRAADATGAPDFPRPKRIVVLVNGGTTDGAEMLAGALRDRAGARLVGATTFGKGTVQDETVLPGDALLRLTVAQWRTPTGAEVDGHGLKPDQVVDGAAAQLDAALAAAAQPVTAGG
jgi:carboxyl-terminal processing protease